MKKYIRLTLVILFLAAGLGSKAQQYSLYHTYTLYDGIDNPWHQFFQDSSCKKWSTNFLFPSFNISGNIQGPLSELTKRAIFSDSLDFRKFPIGKNYYNGINFSQNMNIFMLKIRLSKHRKAELSFDVQNKVEVQAKIKNEFFRLLGGNNYDDFLGEKVRGVFDHKADISIYTQAGIGFRRTIFGDLSGGIKVDLINGIFNASGNVNDSYFYTSDFGDTLQASAHGTYRISKDVGNLMQSQNIDFEKQGRSLLDDYLNWTNRGYAVSFGLNYQINDRFLVTAGVKNLGSIKWQGNVKQYILGDTITFTGGTLDDTTKARQDSLFKNLTNYALDSNQNAYWTNLPTVIEATINGKLGNLFNASFITSYRVYDPNWSFALVNDLGLGAFHFILSGVYNTNTPKKYNMGAQFLFRSKSTDFYFGSNQLLGTYYMYDQMMDSTNTHWDSPLGFDFNLGMAYRFGSCPKIKKSELIARTKDSDGDGITDLNDECVYDPGPKENYGCPWPDTDADGLLDTEDKCPLYAGPIERGGCPLFDVDDDGITDEDDNCPDVKGPIVNNGCPYLDTDKDGILDISDNCPNLVGPIENQGCPYEDSDMDGIFDHLDDCPLVAGTLANKGCPYIDTDGDGILDKDDECITLAGPLDNKGCPYGDSDNDGLLDKDDSCPTIAGPLENKGCPYGDSDNDGLLDKDDSCPTIAGPLANKGCPYSDTDGDGILDKDDKCPTEYGTAKYKGCPAPIVAGAPVKLEDLVKAKVTPEEAELVVVAFDMINYFDFGKATLNPESHESLKRMADVFKSKPGYYLYIEGHTDSIGSVKYNNKLSIDRANSVKAYMVKQGLDKKRIFAKGYGPSRPVTTNKTPEGRESNRRIELSIMERRKQ